MREFSLLVKNRFQEPPLLGEVLQLMTNFSAEVLKDAAQKGAVWINENNTQIRIRDVLKKVSLNSKVIFFYDPRVLSIPELEDAICLEDKKSYGIWFKSAGILSQGSPTGDHSSLLRCIEKKKGNAYLIHRLDRETSGVMVFGYTKESASKLSQLFLENKVIKTYDCIVRGELEVNSSFVIDKNLDSKKAITHVKVIRVFNGQSFLEVKLETGRLHQIRRHLSSIGYPVMGDPKYGKNNKNKSGLKLMASSLSFKDPWTNKYEQWHSPVRLEF
jgi:tRNA pseudouridine32 synthase / 23S rRNA pseudouridine746 synthase